MKKPHCKTSRMVLPHVNRSLPVRAYWNERKKCVSIKQLGRVVCYADNIVLKDCTFHTPTAGGYIKGTVVDARETDHLLGIWERVNYRKCEKPYFKNLHWSPLDGAEFVDVEEDIVAFNLAYRKK